MDPGTEVPSRPWIQPGDDPIGLAEEVDSGAVGEVDDLPTVVPGRVHALTNKPSSAHAVQPEAGGALPLPLMDGVAVGDEDHAQGEQPHHPRAPIRQAPRPERRTGLDGDADDEPEHDEADTAGDQRPGPGCQAPVNAAVRGSNSQKTMATPPSPAAAATMTATGRSSRRPKAARAATPMPPSTAGRGSTVATYRLA